MISPYPVHYSPLLMKGPLVRRSLAGLKTQTRRLYKAKHSEPYEIIDEYDGRTSWPGLTIPLPIEAGSRWPFWMDEAGDYFPIVCPYGMPAIPARGGFPGMPAGRLWVRETWRHNAYVVPGEGPVPGVVHKATYTGVPVREAAWGLETESIWRPGIFMPREACRLEPEIQRVRLEPVQEISASDARQEGVVDLTLNELIEMGCNVTYLAAQLTVRGVRIEGKDVRNLGGMTLQELTGWREVELFGFGWDLINGHRAGGSFADNPDVWVLHYGRVAGA